MWKNIPLQKTFAGLVLIGVSFLFIIVLSSQDEENEEKSRLIKWAEKEGLTEPILNEEGNPILELERIDFPKMKLYNKHCDPANIKSPEKKKECENLKWDVIKRLEDMSLSELQDYFNKRKKKKEEL